MSRTGSLVGEAPVARKDGHETRRMSTQNKGSDRRTQWNGTYEHPTSVIDFDVTDDAYHDLGDVDVGVTRHAERRFIERVDPTEARPRTRIEREFLEADNVELDDDQITDPARFHPGSGAAYIYDPDDWTVITCFVPTERQLPAAEKGSA